MTTDLSTLTYAADKWDAMAGEFRKLKTAYERDVAKISLGQSWQGLAATAANDRFKVTLREYQGAEKEAKAIAALLRDAHGQFTELRGKLKAVRADAVKAGMAVSEQGYVSFDTEKLDAGSRNAYHHDPDYQASVRKAVGEWNEAVAAAVTAISDADEGVRIALEAVVVDGDARDGTFNGFNREAKSDIEQYEADRAADIATRVNGGEKVSTAEMAELKRTFRDNSDDPAFSRTLLNTLGASGTLKLTNRLSEVAHFEDKGRKQDYLGLQKGLAMTLATATKDPDSRFYKDFRADMRKAGVEQFKVDGLSPIPDEQVRGYQSLVTLMQQGSGYSGQFLEDTADDIRKAEESHFRKGNLESVWALRDDFDGKDRGWFANDPLDGVLGIMSQDPKTSTAYLDPDRNDNLKYLLHERDWGTVIDHFATPPGGTTTGMPVMAEDGDVRTGFGAALEAATTGEAPGSYHAVAQHTEPQARILQETINTLAVDKHAEKLPANLTQPLAHVLTSYTPDTHEIYAASESKYDIPLDSSGNVWSDKDGAHMAVGHDRLAAVMRGIADDPEAFGRLYGAEQQYAHDVLERIPQDAGMTTIENRIIESSRAIGAYDGIRSDIIFDERFKKTQWAADFNQGVSTGFGTAMLFNPTSTGPAGDLTSKMLDVWIYESNKEHTAEANLEATRENAKTYDAGMRDVNNMVRAWGDSRGHGIDSDWTKSLLYAGQDQYDWGRDHTLNTLRADR
ncbi:hypothetical protein G6045_05540 [Streptomyces sp. YC504]|uniref:Uncharacterized protein n=1 Tax=Streptomyces mesophilus TaxID=1775132 RepID=A0A6G4XE85_9ACTN|nr:hypothetical protein [Streptomyces mesophilus]NGO75147.1 hypothetical protein [Streptomyces mesophilus]